LGWFAASRALWYETTDFYCLWQGARLVAEGANPYDEARWAAATGGLHPDPSGEQRPSSCPGRYGYPLWTALALVPFGVLPLPAAAGTWAAFSFGAAAIGTIASWRASGGATRGLALFVAIVLSAQPLWLLVISGQITGVMLGLVGLSVFWLARGADARGGAAFGLLVLKPQIVGAFGPLVFAREALGRPRWAVAALVTLGAMLLLTIALMPKWPADWLDEVTGRRARVVTLLPTAWGLSQDLFGTLLVAPLMIAAVAAVAWYLARGHATTVGFAAIALSLSLFAAPYAWSYDQLVLVFPWAFVFARAAASGPGLRIRLYLAGAVVASLLPWALYAVAFSRGYETLNAAVPALTAVVTAWAARSDEARAVARPA
jgi:hypothetical protein